MVCSRTHPNRDMAGLCGLKILLLWAGIISLANSMTQTPTPQQCSYNVTPNKSGFLVEMLNSINAGSTISYKEKGQPGEPIVQSFNQSSYPIKHLKPCTEYELSVTFIDSADKETPCKTEIRTLTMTQDDVKDGSCMPGYVCYRSDWDISSSLSTSNDISAESCKSDIKEFCIKPGFNDLCTDLTSTFTSEMCGTSFSLSKSIPVDPTQINQMVSKEFPAKIESNLPPNCTNLTIDYTCQGADKLKTKKLSELEPFTDYSCTGQIKDSNDTVNLTAVKFRIDCDLTIGFRMEAVTNTSIELSWDTTSQKCRSELPKLKKLSYDCSCGTSPHTQKHSVPATVNPSGGACTITGLNPYTPYFCQVQSKYNNKVAQPPNKPTKVQHTTKAGTPEAITSLTVNVPEHNVITVSCAYDKTKFHGAPKEYVAKLHGVAKKVNEEKCFFEFKDLSYSTEYTLEVFLCNTENLCSKAKKEPVTTSYNDKAVIVRLIIFIIIIIIAAVAVAVAVAVYVLRRRKSRKKINENVNEDVMLELTATYANVPRSEDIR